MHRHAALYLPAKGGKSSLLLDLVARLAITGLTWCTSTSRCTERRGRRRTKWPGRGLTSNELARRSGLKPPTISHARHGRPVSPATVAAIARALRAAPMIEPDLFGSEP
ncbi:MAG: helix-turn-helix domain-containing protein [Steroidobacteraceae bacterium]